MEAKHRESWFRVVILVGGLYVLVGTVFALPSAHVRAWRLAAWLVSGLAYAIHIGYECLWLHRSSVMAALHVALAAAFGGLGLAVAANVHALSIATSGQHHRLLLVALVAWPVITGVPALLVGLGAGALLGRFSRGATPNSRSYGA